MGIDGAMRFAGHNGSDIIDWCQPLSFMSNGQRLWLKIDKAGYFTLHLDDWLMRHDDGAWSVLTSAEVGEDATLLELVMIRTQEDNGARHSLKDVIKEFELEEDK